MRYHHLGLAHAKSHASQAKLARIVVRLCHVTHNVFGEV